LSADRIEAPVAVGVTREAAAPGADGRSDHSLPVGALAQLPQVMRELGHDPWELLESFGVTPTMLAAQPMTPLPASLHGQIAQAAADLTGRDDIGLMLGQRSTLENAGPLRLYVYNAKTTREAVEGLVRFQGLWFRGLASALTFDRGYACLSLAMDGRFPGREQLLTGYLAAMVKHLEGIFPREWRPSQVHVSYRRPTQAESYARFFRAPVLFDQPRHAVFFPASALDAARQGSELMLDRFLRDYMDGLESREQRPFVSQVRRVIEQLLATGRCSVVRVAEVFAMHRVTLHRHLREHGTTYEALLDDARRAMAERLLDETDLPVGEIAAALGYGAPASFVRAFRRWHDKTPGARRRNART
jgi:AraC-like DNA-binding protein